MESPDLASYPTRVAHPYAFVVLASTLLIVLLLPLGVMPIGRDQGNWLAAAQGLLHGKVFFRDYLAFTMPGPAFAYLVGLGFSDDPRVALMIVHTATSVLALHALYFLLRDTLSTTAGVLAAVFFALVWPFLFDFWEVAQKDLLALPWGLLATWAAVRGIKTDSLHPPRSPSDGVERTASPSDEVDRTASPSDGVNRTASSVGWLLASGCFAGIATYAKSVFALPGFYLGVALVLHAAYQHANARRYGASRQIVFDALREIAKRSAFFSLGVGIAYLPLFGYLVYHRALQDAYFSLFKGVFAYAALLSTPYTLHELFQALFVDFGPVALGLIALSLLWIALHPPSRRGLWLLLPLLGFAHTLLIQKRGWLYQRMPLDGLLVALCVLPLAFFLHTTHQALRNKKNPLPSGLSALAVLLLLAWTTTQWVQRSAYFRLHLPAATGQISRTHYLLAYQTERIYGYYPPLFQEALAAWIQKNTHPKDKIVVWGMESALYTLSKRNYIGQSPHNGALANTHFARSLTTWYKQQQARYLRALHRSPPAVFLVRKHDRYFGQSLPSHRSLALVPELPAFLHTHYKPLGTLGQMTIYAHKRLRATFPSSPPWKPYPTKSP